MTEGIEKSIDLRLECGEVRPKRRRGTRKPMDTGPWLVPESLPPPPHTVQSRRLPRRSIPTDQPPSVASSDTEALPTSPPNASPSPAPTPPARHPDLVLRQLHAPDLRRTNRSRDLTSPSSQSPRCVNLGVSQPRIYARLLQGDLEALTASSSSVCSKAEAMSSCSLRRRPNRDASSRQPLTTAATSATISGAAEGVIP